MKDKKSFSLGKLITNVILGVYAFIVVMPIFWVLYTSFKTNMEFTGSPWAFPETLQFVNYYNAWVESNFSAYAINSIICVTISVAVTMVLASTTAYILARAESKLNAMLYMLFISGLFIPVALVLPPEFILMNSLHLTNTRFGLILLYIAFSLPYSILIMYGFYRGLPKELEEAATIDGCTHNQAFWKIIFPLSINGIVTIIIFNFIWVWNDYVFALTFNPDEALRTLPVGLIGLMESFRLKADWVTLFAAMNIIMIPSVIIYIIFQKSLVKGMTDGSVKG